MALRFPLVWAPERATALFEHAPAGVEIRAIPVEPADDPDISQVEMVLVDFQSPLPACFSRMRSLRVVQSLAVGVDGLLPSIPDDVALCSIKGVVDAPVAEWVLTAVLAAEKEFVALHAEQISGAWAERPLRLLADETVLIVGSGSIGRATALRLAPFGCEIHQIARRARPGVHTMDALAQLLPRSDVVVLLVPLTDQTRGLVDATFLEQMKPGALLVNAARGAVVDTDALVSALRAGRLRAVLDVTDPEPLPADHALRNAPGVLVTPHLAGLIGLAHRSMTEFLLAQLERFSRGEALANVVGSDGY